jgi:hypothetical protein
MQGNGLVIRPSPGFLGPLKRLQGFRGLVFLDLSHNQLEQISGLDACPALRVLALAGNRLARIENLAVVPLLDTLDLHDNQIEVMENLDHLTHLRVLNLSGNRLREGLFGAGLAGLQEVNLRGNSIEHVTGLESLTSLSRLLLGCNQISDHAALSSLPRNAAVTELALDGNPIAQLPLYREYWLDRIRTVRVFDGRRVTDEDKRLASISVRRVEDRMRDEDRTKLAKLHRSTAIAACQRRWAAHVARLLKEGTEKLDPESGARPATAAVPSRPTRPAGNIRRVSSGIASTRRVSSALGEGGDTANPGFADSDPVGYDLVPVYDCYESTNRLFFFSKDAFFEVDNDVLWLYGQAWEALDRFVV